MISHENQHDETMLQALNLRAGPPLLGAGSPLPPGALGRGRHRCWCPAVRSFSVSTRPSEPHSLDNERPAHVVDVPGFRIGRVPVTNGEWRQFIDDGGYDEPRWWSDRGWAHRQEAGLRAPQFWNRRRHPHPVRPRRGHPGRRARPARHVLRGRGVRGVGRRAAAHRGGMGEGLRLGPAGRDAAPLPVGRVASPPNIWPTWAGTRCGRLRSVRTRPARRPTVPNRCWATCGSGRPRRFGRGRASRR